MIPPADKTELEEFMNEGQKCNCFAEKEAKLKEQGLKISDACWMLVISSTQIKAQPGLPLQKLLKSKMKRTDPRMITIGYCPFCGTKL